jgi:hypothetical protein
MTSQALQAILYLALSEPIGLLLTVSDVTRARARLYSARREASDPELDRLQIRVSPLADGELIIVKGQEEL